MNLKKILINIFDNKLYFSIFFCSLALIFLCTISIKTIFLPFFQDSLRSDVINEINKLSQYINRTTAFEKTLTEKDNTNLKNILIDFKIKDLYYIPRDAKFVSSIQKNKLIKNNKKELYLSIIKKEKIFSNLSFNEKSTTSVIMEIYTPIIKNKRVTGILEFHYDISNKNFILNTTFKKIYLYTGIFNLTLLLIVLILLYKVSNNNLKFINQKKEYKNLKDILNQTNGYIFTKDVNACYTFANQLVLDLFKTTFENLIGKDDSHFFDLKICDELKKNDNLVLTEGKSIEKEEVALLKNGDIKTYWVAKKPLYNENGVIIGIAGISTDISQLKELENEIKKQKELLDIILDNVDAHIYIKDDKRNFHYVNANTAKVFKKSVKDIIGKQDTSVLPKKMADIFWESDKNVFALNKKISTEETIIDSNGITRHYWSVKVPYTLNNEKLLIGFSSDITEIHILKEKLKKEVITDSLTNLYNKRYFETTANSEFNKSVKESIDLSIIIIDIDYFKHINDTYGHKIGDIILKNVSETFQLLLRKKDSLYRIGGEEFVILLPATNLNIANDLAENIRININEQVFKPDEKIKISITISLGVSSVVSIDKNYEDVLLRADKALYKSKNEGRNKTTFI